MKPPFQLNKGLPFKNECEQAVLGAMLIDPVFAIPHTLGYLQAEDFHEPAHRIIFEAMLKIHKRHIPLDEISLIGELNNNPLLNGVGGTAYIGVLAERTPTAANVRFYARQLRAETDRRTRILRAVAEIEDAYNRPRVAPRGFVRLADVLQTMIDDAYALSIDGRYSGFCTGFDSLDEHLCGLQRGELYIVAGRPSHGKSALCTQIAHNVFQAGGRVAFFPLEAGNTGQTRNLVTMAVEIEGWKLRAGKGQYQTGNELSALNAYLELQRKGIFTLSGAKTPVDMEAVLRDILHEHHGLDLIVIDHLQEMQMPHANRFTQRNQEIQHILQDIRTLAREFAVPVVLAAQVGRAAEGREPVISEIKDSGAIEQIADVIMIIHGEKRGSGLRSLNVAKNRNGTTGRGSLWLDGKFLKFIDQWQPKSL